MPWAIFLYELSPQLSLVVNYIGLCLFDYFSRVCFTKHDLTITHDLILNRQVSCEVVVQQLAIIHV